MKPETTSLNQSVLFADYLDYSIAQHGRNSLGANERFAFDLLCFFPKPIVLTFTSTLIDSTPQQLQMATDFWKNGAIKIHFSSGDSATRYLSRKLSASSKYYSNDYEMNLYQEKSTELFVHTFLRNELEAKQIDYVYPRLSDADINNRRIFLENLARYERQIIEAGNKPLKLTEFDRLAYRIQELADNKQFVFQRNFIIRDLVKHRIYQSDDNVPNLLLQVFDKSYNDAMAQSICANRISNIRNTLTGYELRSILVEVFPSIYGMIVKMNPHQLFLLAQDRSWQLFREYIRQLFENNKSLHEGQSNSISKRLIRWRSVNGVAKEGIEKIFGSVVDATKTISPMSYIEIDNAKEITKNSFDSIRKYLLGYEDFLSEEVIKRGPLVEQICQDIIYKIY